MIYLARCENCGWEDEFGDSFDLPQSVRSCDWCAVELCDYCPSELTDDNEQLCDLCLPKWQAQQAEEPPSGVDAEFEQKPLDFGDDDEDNY